MENLFLKASGYSDYIVSAENESAYQWLKCWPQEHPHISSTLLIGERKSGKRHLAHEWSKYGKTEYIDIHDAMNIPPERAIVFLPSLFDPQLEETLFHLFNHLKKTHTLYISEAPLQNLNISLPDLRSRLLTCHQIEINTPSEEFLKILYSKQFHDLGLKINSDVIDYLVLRLDRKYETVFDTVRLLNTLSIQQHRPITIPFIKANNICY